MGAASTPPSLPGPSDPRDHVVALFKRHLRTYIQNPPENQNFYGTSPAELCDLYHIGQTESEHLRSLVQTTKTTKIRCGEGKPYTMLTDGRGNVVGLMHTPEGPDGEARKEQKKVTTGLLSAVPFESDVGAPTRTSGARKGRGGAAAAGAAAKAAADASPPRLTDIAPQLPSFADDRVLRLPTPRLLARMRTKDKLPETVFSDGSGARDWVAYVANGTKNAGKTRGVMATLDGNVCACLPTTSSAHGDGTHIPQLLLRAPAGLTVIGFIPAAAMERVLKENEHRSHFFEIFPRLLATKGAFTLDSKAARDTFKHIADFENVRVLYEELHAEQKAWLGKDVTRMTPAQRREHDAQGVKVLLKERALLKKFAQDAPQGANRLECLQQDYHATLSGTRLGAAPEHHNEPHVAVTALCFSELPPHVVVVDPVGYGAGDEHQPDRSFARYRGVQSALCRVADVNASSVPRHGQRNQSLLSHVNIQDMLCVEDRNVSTVELRVPIGTFGRTAEVEAQPENYARHWFLRAAGVTAVADVPRADEEVAAFQTHCDRLERTLEHELHLPRHCLTWLRRTCILVAADAIPTFLSPAFLQLVSLASFQRVKASIYALNNHLSILLGLLARAGKAAGGKSPKGATATKIIFNKQTFARAYNNVNTECLCPAQFQAAGERPLGKALADFLERLKDRPEDKDQMRVYLFRDVLWPLLGKLKEVAASMTKTITSNAVCKYIGALWLKPSGSGGGGADAAAAAKEQTNDPITARMRRILRPLVAREVRARIEASALASLQRACRSGWKKRSWSSRLRQDETRQEDLVYASEEQILRRCVDHLLTNAAARADFLGGLDKEKHDVLVAYFSDWTADMPKDMPVFKTFEMVCNHFDDPRKQAEADAFFSHLKREPLPPYNRSIELDAPTPQIARLGDAQKPPTQWAGDGARVRTLLAKACEPTPACTAPPVPVRVRIVADDAVDPVYRRAVVYDQFEATVTRSTWKTVASWAQGARALRRATAFSPGMEGVLGVLPPKAEDIPFSAAVDDATKRWARGVVKDAAERVEGATLDHLEHRYEACPLVTFLSAGPGEGDDAKAEPRYSEALGLLNTRQESTHTRYNPARTYTRKGQRHTVPPTRFVVAFDATVRRLAGVTGRIAREVYPDPEETYADSLPLWIVFRQRFPVALELEQLRALFRDVFLFPEMAVASDNVTRCKVENSRQQGRYHPASLQDAVAVVQRSAAAFKRAQFLQITAEVVRAFGEFSGEARMVGVDPAPTLTAEESQQFRSSLGSFLRPIYSAGDTPVELLFKHGTVKQQLENFVRLFHVVGEAKRAGQAKKRWQASKQAKELLFQAPFDSLTVARGEANSAVAGEVAHFRREFAKAKETKEPDAQETCWNRLCRLAETFAQVHANAHKIEAAVLFFCLPRTLPAFARSVTDNRTALLDLDTYEHSCVAHRPSARTYRGPVVIDLDLLAHLNVWTGTREFWTAVQRDPRNDSVLDKVKRAGRASTREDTRANDSALSAAVSALMVNHSDRVSLFPRSSGRATIPSMLLGTAHNTVHDNRVVCLVDPRASRSQAFLQHFAVQLDQAPPPAAASAVHTVGPADEDTSDTDEDTSVFDADPYDMTSLNRGCDILGLYTLASAASDLLNGKRTRTEHSAASSPCPQRRRVA